MNSVHNGVGRGNIDKVNDFIFDVFAGMYFLNKLLPAFGYYLPGTVFLVLFAYLILFSLSRINAMPKEGNFLNMLLLLSVAVLTCVKFVFGGKATNVPIYLYGEMQVILYGMIVLSYQSKEREAKIKKLFSFVLINYVITGVTTIIGNIKYPQASRFLATFSSSDYLYGVYTKNNIGGFTFVYELVLIVPLIIYMLKKKRINLLIGVSILFMIGIIIINAEYTTALLFYIISLMTILVHNLTLGKTVGLFSVLAAVMFSASSFLSNVFLKLSVSINNPMFSTRFKYIAYSLIGKSMRDDSGVGDRMDLYKKSLDLFAESKGMGVWNERSVGGHSFIFDAMGSFGIIGIIAVIIVYFTVYELYLKPYKNKEFYGYMVWSYLVAVVLAFLNPKAYYFFFMVMLPLFAISMSDDLGEK